MLRTGTVFWKDVYTPTEYSHTRSYFAADNKLRYIQRYAGPTGTKNGSWEEYWYDALGRKVLTRARRDSLCGGAGNFNCASYIERTVWDGDQILYERRGLGGDNATAGELNTAVSSNAYDYGEVGYVHAGGIDAPLVLMDGRVPNYNWRGLPESSVWADGTAADCSVSGGGTCTTIAWPSTGVYLRPVGNTGGNQPRWVGSLLANGVGSTGMAYRRNRFYDGATGQFNQQDPIGLAGGSNSYGFVGGDPVNYADPFGLWPFRTHNKIIDKALPNVGKLDRALIKLGSFIHDVTTQSKSQSYLHSMSEKGQNALAQKAGTAEFVANATTAATGFEASGSHAMAMISLGAAIHPLMDATSPSHTDGKGNPRVWNPSDLKAHRAGEKGSPTAAQQNQMSKQISDTYQRVVSP